MLGKGGLRLQMELTNLEIGDFFYYLGIPNIIRRAIVIKEIGKRVSDSDMI